MNTWTPIWSFIVDSSLWEEPYHVRLLFLTMLSLKDADHVVRWDGYKLSKKSHIKPEECVDGLKVLSSPDKRRAAFDCLEEQQYEGRRIEKVSAGWLVLNGEKYREMVRSINIRKYKTEWQRQKREQEKGIVILRGREAEVYLQSQGDSVKKRLKVVQHLGIASGGKMAIDISLNGSQ